MKEEGKVKKRKIVVISPGVSYKHGLINTLCHILDNNARICGIFKGNIPNTLLVFDCLSNNSQFIKIPRITRIHTLDSILETKRILRQIVSTNADCDNTVFLFVNSDSSLVSTILPKDSKIVVLMLELPMRFRSRWHKENKFVKHTALHLYYNILSLYEEKVLTHAQFVIVPNEERATLMSDLYNKDIYIIENFPRFDIIEKYKKLTDKNVSMSHNSVRCVYNGSLSPERKILNVVNLSQMMPNVEIDFYGKFSSKVFEKKFRNSIAISKGINYLGVLPNEKMIEVISDYQFGLLPYSFLNANNLLCSPLKLYEFLLRGVPVIATPNPPLQRIILKYKCGILWNFKDESIATKIFKLDYLQLRKSAIDAFNDMFDIFQIHIQEVANRILNL